MARYTSNRFKDIVIGLPNYSELKTSLQIVGKVGIGTNDAKTPLWVEGNTNFVGIVTSTEGFKVIGAGAGDALMADGTTSPVDAMGTLKDSGDTIRVEANTSGIAISGISTFSDDIHIETGDLIFLNNAHKISNSSSSGNIAIQGGPTYAGGRIVLTGGLTSGGGTGDIRFYADTTQTPVERLRIDSDGKLLLRSGDHPSNINAGGFHNALQVEGTDAPTSSIAIVRNSNDDNPAYLNFGKSRGTGIGSTMPFVANDDPLGTINFTGASDGSHAGEVIFNSFASIRAYADGTPDTGNAPGRLTFYTGLAGDTNPQERLRIDSSGNVGIGTNKPTDDPVHTDNTAKLTVGIVTTNNLYVGIVTATDVWVSGAVTATTFKGTLDGNASGLTGTPNITVGVLNASSGTINGDFEVTGELTYADVTNVDSIGLVTARSGIHVGPITAGVATVSTDGNASFTGIVTATSFSVTGAAAGAVLMADGTTNALNAEKLIDANDATRVEANVHGAVVSGILTAASFSGALTGDVTGDTSGSSGSCTGNSLTATDLSINATNRLLYQSANNNTDIMTEGNSGQVLQSNGDGNVPTWVDAAPSSAISGLTLRQDGDQVGDASGVSQINFVGAAVTFTSTAGLGTVTIQTESVSSVIMSMIF